MHDIFTPQPVKDAAVFYVRAVLLDWPDEFCVQILSHLRDAALPETRLVLVYLLSVMTRTQTQKSTQLRISVSLPSFTGHAQSSISLRS